jgi:hypothetical protein
LAVGRAGIRPYSLVGHPCPRESLPTTNRPSRSTYERRGVGLKLEAGVTARQIDRRLKSGRLHEIHRGIYLVGHAVPPPYGREMAALLVHRREGALSHRSATALWNLTPYPLPATSASRSRLEGAPQGAALRSTAPP